MTTFRGHVTLAGAGPGDPGLLTVAALRALESADVVLYDALLSRETLGFCRPGAEQIDVGKRAGAHSMSQDEINTLIGEKAREGKHVVRLKGGDPFVFGRGGEEALACRAAGVPFTLIPGVTSAVAVPAFAGIPVTHRGVARNFAVVTGSEAGDAAIDWQALAGIDTVVVLMGASSLPEAARRLVEAGRSPETPAASVSNGTLPGQRSILATLGTIADAVAREGLTTPLITVIGEVARFHDELGRAAKGPLAGKSVVVTRTRSQASNLRRMLEALGAGGIEAPALEIRHEAPELVTDERAGSRWDWIVFSSQNGVDAFFAALRSAGRDARSLGTTKVAAVGPATSAAAERHGIVSDFVPSVATGEAMAAELPRVQGARVLLPCGSLSEDRLADGLRARGAHIEQVRVYETRPRPLDNETRRSVLEADAITFASASSARFLRQALGEARVPERTALCVIGTQAAAAAREAFGRVDAVAETPSIDGLVAAVLGALA